jgi:hypothetical protein
MEKTIMSKTLESPVSSMRLAAAAKAAIFMVARGFSALVDEHSLALRAATEATLPRRRLTELRAMYTAPNAKRRSTAAKGNFIRAFESRAVVRGFVMGFNAVALVIALGLIALVAF